jgi:hypothetical protein
MTTETDDELQGFDHAERDALAQCLQALEDPAPGVRHG